MEGCSSCKSTDLPDSWVFCVHCGAKREENEEQMVFCVGCGAKIPSSALFCEECGTRQPVEEDGTEIDPERDLPPEPATPYVPEGLGFSDTDLDQIESLFSHNTTKKPSKPSPPDNPPPQLPASTPFKKPSPPGNPPPQLPGASTPSKPSKPSPPDNPPPQLPAASTPFKKPSPPDNPPPQLPVSTPFKKPSPPDNPSPQLSAWTPFKKPSPPDNPPPQLPATPSNPEPQNPVQLRKPLPTLPPTPQVKSPETSPREGQPSLLSSESSPIVTKDPHKDPKRRRNFTFKPGASQLTKGPPLPSGTPAVVPPEPVTRSPQPEQTEEKSSKEMSGKGGKKVRSMVVLRERSQTSRKLIQTGFGKIKQTKSKIVNKKSSEEASAAIVISAPASKSPEKVPSIPSSSSAPTSSPSLLHSSSPPPVPERPSGELLQALSVNRKPETQAEGYNKPLPRYPPVRPPPVVKTEEGVNGEEKKGANGFHPANVPFRPKPPNRNASAPVLPYHKPERELPMIPSRKVTVTPSAAAAVIPVMTVTVPETEPLEEETDRSRSPSVVTEWKHVKLDENAARERIELEMERLAIQEEIEKKKKQEQKQVQKEEDELKKKQEQKEKQENKEREQKEKQEQKEREKKMVEEEEARKIQEDKEKKIEIEKQEDEYIRAKRKEHIRRLENRTHRFGPKIQSIYQHVPTNVKVLDFKLSGAELKKHDKKRFAMFTIDVIWKECAWTVYRRFSQFFDFDWTLKRKTKIVLATRLPKKKLKGMSVSPEAMEKRKVKLALYVQGIVAQQLDFLNNEKYEQILIRFFGPFQMGDVKPQGEKLPFKVVVQ